MLKQYLFLSIITALVVSITLVILSRSNTKVAGLFTSQPTSETLTSLATNPEFIKAVQTHLGSVPAESGTGTKGEKGDKGDIGNQGVNGSNGQNGMAGTGGGAGADGTNGLNGANGNAGEKGSIGPQGPQGLPGLTGPQGEKGETGEAGLTGPKGDKGDTGATGPQGMAGQDGADGTIYDVSGQGLELTSNTLGLELDGASLTTSVSGLRINSSLTSNWDAAYSWGNHATAGYAKLLGLAGGQTLIGGTAANNVLTLQANSATSGNTATQAGIQFLVGNNGATTALSILHNGNIGIGTSSSYGKLNINGTVTTTSEGDIFSQRDASTNATYPLLARYFDTSQTSFSGGTFLFGTGNNAWVGVEKPGTNPISRFRVLANTSVFSGNVGITTDNSNSITPFQFIQVSNLSDNPSVTTFNGSAYPVSDWNPAVVGFSNGGSCGSNWSGGTLNGFKYWWDNSGGNWRLSIDMSGPTDGCNSVQVMFVRKEFSSRAGYGF